MQILIFNTTSAGVHCHAFPKGPKVGLIYSAAVEPCPEEESPPFGSLWKYINIWNTYSWFPEQRWTGTSMEHILSGCLMSAARMKSSERKNCHRWVHLPLRIYHEQAVWGHFSTQPGTRRTAKLSLSRTSPRQQICLSREGSGKAERWETAEKRTKKQRWRRRFWEKFPRRNEGGTGRGAKSIHIREKWKNESLPACQIMIEPWGFTEDHLAFGKLAAPLVICPLLGDAPRHRTACSGPSHQQAAGPWDGETFFTTIYQFSPCLIQPWVATETHASWLGHIAPNPLLLPCSSHAYIYCLFIRQHKFKYKFSAEHNSSNGH